MIPDFVEEDLTALKKQIQPYAEDGCAPNGIPIEDLAPVHVVERLLRRIEYLEAAINAEENVYDPCGQSDIKDAYFIWHDDDFTEENYPLIYNEPAIQQVIREKKERDARNKRVEFTPPPSGPPYVFFKIINERVNDQ